MQNAHPPPESGLNEGEVGPCVRSRNRVIVCDGDEYAFGSLVLDCVR